MLFINLDKMKPIKEYHYQTFEYDITIDAAKSLQEMKQDIEAALAHIFDEKPAIAALYHININSEASEEQFISIINLIFVVFFNLLINNEGRKRERRLDIPAALTTVHTSASLLKRAINAQTKVDLFNVEISCGDMHYIMIDSKENSHE